MNSLLEKTQNNSVAFSDALLVYHDMAIRVGLPSPAKLMCGHSVKTDLQLVYLQEQNTDKSRAKYAARYLKRVTVPQYSVDKPIWMQDPVTKHWKDGKISGVLQKLEFLCNSQEDIENI